MSQQMSNEQTEQQELWTLATLSCRIVPLGDSSSGPDWTLENKNQQSGNGI